MSTANSFSISLGVGADQTVAIARRALLELGWPVTLDEADRLVASEDFSKLCCNRQPIEVELRIVPSSDGEANLDILAKVPGRGPIASDHLRRQSLAMVRKLRGLSADARQVPRAPESAKR